MARVNVVWHHGGTFVETPKPAYVGELATGFSGDIDTDVMSYCELSWYVRSLGYIEFEGIYYRGLNEECFRSMDDKSLVELANTLKDGDEVHFYIKHLISTPVLLVDVGIDTVDPIPAGIHPEAPIVVEEVVVEEGDKVGVEEGEKDGGEECDDVGGEDVGDEGYEEEDDEDGGEEDSDEFDVDYSEDSETQSLTIDLSDDSDVDDELRELRAEARVKRAREKKHKEKFGNVEVNLGEVGADEGYENWDKDANNYTGKIGGDEPYYASDSDYSLETDVSEDDEGVSREVRRRRSRHNVYDPNCVCPNWEIDMVFESVQQFREALAKYAIHMGVKLDLRPNEPRRVTATCKHQGCDWRLHASFEGRSQNFKIKTYRPIHKCRRYNTNKMCNSKFLAQYFESRIISQPGIKLWEIQSMCRKELKMHVGVTICRRAKARILKKHMGDYKEEYANLHGYVEEVNRSNPGSTCFVVVDKDAETGKELFRRFYVCLHSMKQGWKEGCRRIIGIDACFLKGPVEGQLFTAIGKDGNRQMFPIAWEVTSQESTSTWTKFLKALKQDLDLGIGEDLTIMSDMHLGIRAAVRNLFPEAEHRFCARHVYANWAKHWRGSERRHKFWACCWSTFQLELKDKIDELGKLGQGLVEDFLEYGKESFCKPYFRTEVQCDVCENNMCETFNAWIRAARHKSIISMLEEIRKQVMDRCRKMNQFARTWICDIAPMAMHRLEKNKLKAMECDMLWNGDNGFEIQDGDYGHIVDLRNNTCSCRSWQLKGIPCAHAICAMNHLKIEPDEHVVHWHKKETYLKAYAYPLQPVLGMRMWQANDYPPIEPPQIRKKRGRKRVNRRKPRDEPKKVGKLSRKGSVITYSVCKGEGHNKKGCPTKKAGQASGNQGSTSNPTRPRRSGQASGTRSEGVPTTMNQARRRSEGVPTTRSQGAQASQANGNQAGQATGKRVQDDNGNAGQSKKRGRLVGAGLYINTTTGLSILNPGLESRRIVRCPRVPLKDASGRVDFASQSRGLQWQGKRAITRSQISKNNPNTADQAPFSSQTSSNMP